MTYGITTRFELVEFCLRFIRYLRLMLHTLVGIRSGSFNIKHLNLPGMEFPKNNN